MVTKLLGESFFVLESFASPIYLLLTFYHDVQASLLQQVIDPDIFPGGLWLVSINTAKLLRKFWLLLSDHNFCTWEKLEKHIAYIYAEQ